MKMKVRRNPPLLRDVLRKLKYRKLVCIDCISYAMCKSKVINGKLPPYSNTLSLLQECSIAAESVYYIMINAHSKRINKLEVLDGVLLKAYIVYTCFYAICNTVLL